ncbi:MAG: hypothetical protein U0324_41130 [Polyangiales bacterium]
MTRPTRPLATAALAGALLMGCGLREAVARGTATHTYQAHCDAVLPAARQALLDRGYEPREGGDALVVETEWRPREFASKSPALPTRDRYTARLVAAGPSSCGLRVTRVADGAWPTSERDLEVEWDVLRAVDPAAARHIEAGDAPGAARTR